MELAIQSSLYHRHRAPLKSETRPHRITLALQWPATLRSEGFLFHWNSEYPLLPGVATEKEIRLGTHLGVGLKGITA